MATLYVLIGLPASGKSTWRENYLASNPESDCVICSTDDLIEEYASANGMTYSEAFGKVNFKDLNARFRNRFRQAINAGKDVIVDRTNMSVKSRKEYLKNIPDSYEKVAVVFVVPDPELKRRLAAREAATGKGIPEQVINDMAARYVAPSREEFDRIVRITP